MASAGVLARDIRTDHKEIISTASVLADVYIKERLGCPVTSTEKSAPSFTRKFVRLANELEPRHVSQYDDMCSRLVINGRTVYGIFLQTADELFKNGINWGRVVGLYAFAGSLCQTCTSCGLQATVEEVKKWLIAYIRLNLANWIIDQGGWVREFVPT